MFTGLITDLGCIETLENKGGGLVLTSVTRLPLSDLALGASVAHNGVCLTVTEAVDKGESRYFKTYAAPETLRKTSMSYWKEGQPINLEPSLRLGDSLGGHIVLGHVDGVVSLASRQADDDCSIFTFSCPPSLLRFIAYKGSVALDGTSLTITEAGTDSFSVMVIPHTLAHTCFGHYTVGDQINLEVDMMARYADRLLESHISSSQSSK